MATKNIINQSSEIAKNIIQATGIQSFQGIPTKVSDIVVPTISVNPFETITINHMASIDTVSNGTTTIYTTPTASTKKKYYLYGFNISYFSDATNTDTTRGIQVYLGGASLILCRLVKPSLTYTRESLNFILPKPILIDAGTNITVNQTIAGGGSAETCATIYGNIVYDN